jgi:hypothetical protein
VPFDGSVQHPIKQVAIRIPRVQKWNREAEYFNSPLGGTLSVTKCNTYPHARRVPMGLGLVGFPTKNETSPGALPRPWPFLECSQKVAKLA